MRGLHDTSAIAPRLRCRAFAAATVTAQQQAPPKDDSAVVPVSQCGGTDQRHRDRHRSNGRFVSNLRREDFRIFEDGQEQPVTHFSNERVPVSLGIALDTSDSMDGEKMSAARDALDASCSICSIRRTKCSSIASRTFPSSSRAGRPTGSGAVAARPPDPDGGTAMYDAVAEAVPLAQDGSASQEGNAHHLRRQRHEQRDDRRRGQAPDPRERSDGLRDRHRRPEHRDHAARAARAPRQPPRSRFRFRAGGRPAGRRRRPDDAARTPGWTIA